jgi:cellulose 1,4-beta-cellobiosidase
VQLTSPTDGGTVGKSVTMGATASDDKAVKKVEFYLDGKLVNTDTAASWSYSTNTKRLSAGSHTATAKAYDAEGLSASSSVTFKK